MSVLQEFTTYFIIETLLLFSLLFTQEFIQHFHFIIKTNAWSLSGNKINHNKYNNLKLTFLIVVSSFLHLLLTFEL